MYLKLVDTNLRKLPNLGGYKKDPKIPSNMMRWGNAQLLQKNEQVIVS